VGLTASDYIYITVAQNGNKSVDVPILLSDIDPRLSHFDVRLTYSKIDKLVRQKIRRKIVCFFLFFFFEKVSYRLANSLDR
jgi:hypothetical protein